MAKSKVILDPLAACEALGLLVDKAIEYAQNFVDRSQDATLMAALCKLQGARTLIDRKIAPVEMPPEEYMEGDE